MEKVSSTQNQPSPGDSKEHLTDKYATCREDIAEVAIADIQPCPIIPDYKTPTTVHPANHCPDPGREYLYRWMALHRSRRRPPANQPSGAISTTLPSTPISNWPSERPPSGSCPRAASARMPNWLATPIAYAKPLKAHRMTWCCSPMVVIGVVSALPILKKKHRAVLASRLGKSPTTISKYLQHGKGLNDETMEELVKAGAPKQFFEAVQTQKEIGTAGLHAKKKDEAAIVAEISSLVSAWWKESQRPVPPKTTPPESPQPPQARRPTAPTRPSQSHNQPPTASRGAHQERSDASGNPATGAPPITGETGVTAELKRIGETLIEIADSQESPTPQQVETIRRLVQELAVLHQRLVHPSEPERSGNGGSI
jgi:hypothetical protein